MDFDTEVAALADRYGAPPGLQEEVARLVRRAASVTTVREGGPYRVTRGGCWSGMPAYSRAANRSGNAPGLRYQLVGFRLARSVP